MGKEAIRIVKPIQAKLKWFPSYMRVKLWPAGKACVAKSCFFFFCSDPIFSSRAVCIGVRHSKVLTFSVATPP